MKKIYVLFCSLAMSFGAFAQKDNVGIGTTQPDQSAILDLNSSSKGLLIPRMSLEQRGTIQNPANGLMIYQTDFLSGFYYYNGKDWTPIATATGANSVASTQTTTWDVSGNTLTGTEFIGSNNPQPLIFKVNGQLNGSVNPSSGSVNGSVFLGASSGSNIMSSNGNLGFGAYSMLGQVGGTGSFNVGIGNGALYSNNNGVNNAALGNSALFSNTNGNDNLAIGGNSLRSNTLGSDNIGIGRQALFTNTIGIQNVAIGSNAGYLSTGTGNAFIGANAGYNETGNNKLYIANTSTTKPLIYGEFDNSIMKVNVGGTNSATQGFLAIGDFGAATPMSTVGGYRLIVQDGILTEKIKVAVKNSTDWADYVFEKDYKRMSLEQVEKFVKENKHLPNVPSADEMTTNGLDVTKTSAKLMEKIEELTLYIIELNKRIKELEKK